MDVCACASVSVCFCGWRGVVLGSAGQMPVNCLPGEPGNLESNEHSGEGRPPTTVGIYSRRTRRY